MTSPKQRPAYLSYITGFYTFLASQRQVQQIIFLGCNPAENPATPTATALAAYRRQAELNPNVFNQYCDLTDFANFTFKPVPSVYMLVLLPSDIMPELLQQVLRQAVVPGTTCIKQVLPSVRIHDATAHVYPQSIQVTLLQLHRYGTACSHL